MTFSLLFLAFQKKKMYRAVELGYNCRVEMFDRKIRSIECTSNHLIRENGNSFSMIRRTIRVLNFETIWMKCLSLAWKMAKTSFRMSMCVCDDDKKKTKPNYCDLCCTQHESVFRTKEIFSRHRTISILIHTSPSTEQLLRCIMYVIAMTG